MIGGCYGNSGRPHLRLLSSDMKGFIVVNVNGIQVATSITVVPQQPTVVITPACTRCCPQHHVNTVRCSAGSVAPSRPVATQQLRSSVQRGIAKDEMRDEVCSGNRQEGHLNAVKASDDSCLQNRRTAISRSDDDLCIRRANTSITTRCEDEPPIRNVDVVERPAVRPAWTSECRSRRHRDNKVDAPIPVAAKQTVARRGNSRRFADVKHNLSATGKVVGSTCHDDRDTSPGANHQQSPVDFATCTDQLTNNIYASLAAFQDVQEKDVIDAVRGYLRRQPLPSSSRRGRPATGRRPATAVDGGGSRTVELRQGDVGPLSSLVVIRPATPQPRTSCTNGRPPTWSDGQPKAATDKALTSDDSHCELWHDSRQARQQKQQQRLVVRTSSRATASTCKSQSLNSLMYDDHTWFSSSQCQQ